MRGPWPTGGGGCCVKNKLKTHVPKNLGKKRKRKERNEKRKLKTYEEKRREFE
jgi:hypothetical protein